MPANSVGRLVVPPAAGYPWKEQHPCTVQEPPSRRRAALAASRSSPRWPWPRAWPASARANAATTIVPTPAETGIDGPVVRNDSIELKEDNGGRLFTRTSSSGNFTQQSTGLAYALSGCLGNTTPPAPSTNNSPRSRIVVNGPRVTSPVGTTGPVVLSASSPAKSLALFSNAESVITPPPAPSRDAYLGGPWSTNLSLAGKPAGVYTVTTAITNMLKTGLGACTPGTPGLAATPGTPLNTFTAGDRTVSWTFEYRPWQQKFTDLLGTGTIQMNTLPEEFQFDVSSVSSPIVAAPPARRR